MIKMSNTNPYPVINKELCKGCERCVISCPKEVIELSSNLNEAGYPYAYYANEGCVGCRDCYYTCPEPLAIEIHSYKRKVNNETIKLVVGDKEYDITSDMVDIRVSAKDGYNVAKEGNNFIILNLINFVNYLINKYKAFVRLELYEYVYIPKKPYFSRVTTFFSAMLRDIFSIITIIDKICSSP